MTLKIPPPPPLTKDQVLNRWLLELTSILNGAGNVTATAVTQPPGTNNDDIATCAFVLANTASAPATALPLMDGAAAIGGSTKYARQDHVHPSDTTRAPLASPTFTGDPKAPTPAPGDNDTSVATTAFVVLSFAPLASPALTGNPTAPTPAPGDNDTSVATTAFVAALAAATPVVRNGAGAPAAGLGSVNDWYANIGGAVGARIYVKTAVGTWTAFPF